MGLLQTVNIDGYGNQLRLYADETGTNIANNTSSVHAYLDLYVVGTVASSNVNVAVSGIGNQSLGYQYYGRGTHRLVDGYFDAGHNADGTGSVYISGYFHSAIGNWDLGGTLGLSRIPRQANITNAPDFNDEENPTIKYSNPAGNSVSSLQIRIENANGNTAYADYRDISKTGNSYTFNLTDTERNTLRNATPNGSTMTVRFNLKTVLGGNTFNSIVNRTMSIVNGNPTFEDFDYSTNLRELTGNNATIINGKTTTTITIPVSKRAIGNKGASILRYSFECGNSTNLANYSDNSDVSVLLTNCNSDIIKVTAIDSRGFETTINKIVPNFKNYYSPTFVSQSVERQDGIEETVYLDTKFNFWNYNFGNARNRIEYLKYRVKESSSDTFSNWYDINVSSLLINKEEATLNNYIIYLDGISQGFSIGTTYDIQLQVIDSTDATESSIFTLYDGLVAFSILRDNNGNYHIGINGMPDLENTLKVHGTISNE